MLSQIFFYVGLFIMGHLDFPWKPRQVLKSLYYLLDGEAFEPYSLRCPGDMYLGSL
jgi:hypothetical protein